MRLGLFRARQGHWAWHARLFPHLAAIAGMVFLVAYLLFYSYMPAITAHGIAIEVPNILDRRLEELAPMLEARALAFKVHPDSEFMPEKPPLTVLKQYPLPGQRVKRGRKIHVVLNARHPPMIAMPDLVDGSVKNAQILLNTHKLRLGRIEYVSDLAQNAVLEQRYRGERIAAGAPIPQGARVDFVVGDGLHRNRISVPNLIGLQEQEARMMAIGSGLRIDSIHYATQNRAAPLAIGEEDTLRLRQALVGPGLVFQQTLEAHSKARIGEAISLWVAE